MDLKVELRHGRNMSEDLMEKLRNVLTAFFSRHGLTGKRLVHFMGEAPDGEQIQEVVPVSLSEILVLLHARAENGQVFRCGLVASSGFSPKALFEKLGGGVPSAKVYRRSHRGPPGGGGNGPSSVSEKK